MAVSWYLDILGFDANHASSVVITLTNYKKFARQNKNLRVEKPRIQGAPTASQQKKPGTRTSDESLARPGHEACSRGPKVLTRNRKGKMNERKKNKNNTVVDPPLQLQLQLL